MLKINKVSLSYQRQRALNDVSLSIGQSDFTALIGSNGAGKSSLINAISGLLKISGGSIEFEGRTISGMQADEIASMGLVQVPEGRKLFSGMTVEENLEIGAYLPGPRKNYAKNLANVFDMFPLLRDRRKQSAGSLSGGEQQMLAISRALLTDPKLLMLDEPSLGLAPIVTLEIFRILKELNERGLTILLITQEVMQSLSITKKGYLIENGFITLSGPSSELLKDARVKESYLGL